MNKITREIRFFFLFIAVLAINLHLIIPHDHHPVESVASQEDTCPVTNNKTNHHSGFPVHCHACNDLTSEKAVTLDIIRNFHYKYFIISDTFDLAAIKLYPAGIRIIESSVLPFKSDTPELYLLRAPPSLG